MSELQALQGQPTEATASLIRRLIAERRDAREEVKRLRAENTRARDALYDAICAVSNGKLCQGAYNVHAPLISTERVERWRDALKEDGT